MKIREATHDDIPAMLALGEAMHQESRYAVHAWNTDKVRHLIGALVAGDNGLALVAELEGEIVGGFLGSLSAHYFTNAMTASDYALFVAPAHRGSSAAAHLVGRFIAWARGHNADMIQIGTTTGVAEDRTVRLFERAGFERVGQLLELKDN